MLSGGYCYINKASNSADMKNNSSMYIHFIGGIVGGTSSSSGSPTVIIRNAFNTGNIYTVGSSYSIGGIIGYNGSTQVIYNSYNMGNISFESGASVIGGIAGNVSSSSGVIYNCFSTSVISTNADSYDIGGFIGTGGNGFVNCYANSANVDLNGSSSASITGMSEAEMKTSTFKDTLTAGRYSTTDDSEWVYDANKNNGYPYLKDVPLFE